MQKLFLLIISLIGIYSQSLAQFSFGISYEYARPQGDMAINIREAHGAILQGMYFIPKSMISVGLELGISGYGHQKQRQTFTFSDGTQTETDVHVNNNIDNLHLISRLNLSKSTLFQPYFQGKIGYSRFYTDLRIDDPQDRDACHPLQHDILQSSYGLSGGIGVGTLLDLNAFFKKINKNRFFVDLSTHYTTGTSARYMSIKEPATMTNMTFDEVHAQFINVQSQVVHEHHVGYVYQTPIRMLQFRFGFTLKF